VGGPGIAFVGGCGSVFLTAFVAGGSGVPGRAGVLGGACPLIVPPAMITSVAIKTLLLMFIRLLKQQGYPIESPGRPRQRLTLSSF
jgi:hypothetical protein